MIALIIFVFGDLCIFNERFIPRFLWSFLFSVNLKKKREKCRHCGKTAMVPLIIFFAVNLAALDGAIPKLHVKNLPEKNCRWEGAIPILQVKNLQVRRCHPNTAGGSKAPSQNCRWSMQFGLGTRRMPMCGKLRYSFRRTLILSCARTFLQRKPVLKDIFSPARLQHISVNMLRILSLRTRFYRRAGPVVFYSHQSCLPYGGPLCENLTLHNGNLKKNNPNLFYYLE